MLSGRSMTLAAAPQLEAAAMLGSASGWSGVDHHRSAAAVAVAPGAMLRRYLTNMSGGARVEADDG